MTGRTAKPLIGITTYVEPAAWGAWKLDAALVPYDYVRAVEKAGGRAVLVPPDAEGVEEILDAVDGLIFSGGGDVGAESTRDGGEFPLLVAALERDLPVLAICRGIELLNVVRGGDLVEHIPDVVGHEEHREVVGTFSQHPVRVDPDSKLGEVRGDVMSHHHQGLRAVGGGLREVAWAEDGIVEAVEDPDKAFLVGVLWHPEAGEDMRLFEQLVEAARG
jgi:putative glutamine amidotransferase